MLRARSDRTVLPAGRSLAFDLGRGDLLVMGGSCQRTWQQAIPKSRTVGHEPRIAIVFRPKWEPLPAGLGGVSVCPRASGGFEDDLFAVVELVVEQLEAARRFGKWEPMSDHEAWVDITALDTLQKWSQVTMRVTLAGANSE